MLVTVTLAPDWVTLPFQSWVTVCPLAKLHFSVQLDSGSPRLVMARLAPKPPGHWLVRVRVPGRGGGAWAAGGVSVTSPAAIRAAALPAATMRRRRGREEAFMRAYSSIRPGRAAPADARARTAGGRGSAGRHCHRPYRTPCPACGRLPHHGREHGMEPLPPLRHPRTETPPWQPPGGPPPPM